MPRYTRIIHSGSWRNVHACICNGGIEYVQLSECCWSGFVVGVCADSRAAAGAVCRCRRRLGRRWCWAGRRRRSWPDGEWCVTPTAGHRRHHPALAITTRISVVARCSGGQLHPLPPSILAHRKILFLLESKEEFALYRRMKFIICISHYCWVHLKCNFLMQTDTHCTSRFRVTFLHMRYATDNSKWTSLLVFITNFAAENLQLSVGNRNIATFCPQIFKPTPPLGIRRLLAAAAADITNMACTLHAILSLHLLPSYARPPCVRIWQATTKAYNLRMILFTNNFFWRL